MVFEEQKSSQGGWNRVAEEEQGPREGGMRSVPQRECQTGRGVGSSIRDGGSDWLDLILFLKDRILYIVWNVIQP